MKANWKFWSGLCLAAMFTGCSTDRPLLRWWNRGDSCRTCIGAEPIASYGTPIASSAPCEIGSGCNSGVSLGYPSADFGEHIVPGSTSYNDGTLVSPEALPGPIRRN